MENKTKRYPKIDQIRGIAVILMIFFHLFYDLTIFGFTKINFTEDPFWYYLPRVIVFLFLLCSGISLGLSKHHENFLKKTLFRTLKLAIWALIISTTTFFLFKEIWIYFGILHCISLSILLGMPLVHRPKIALISSFLIVSALLLPSNTRLWLELSHKSMDYIPLVPWFSCFLLGIFIASIIDKFKCFNYLDYFIKITKIDTFLQFLGKNSLAIYLVHQPVIYGIVLGIRTII